MLTLTHYLVLAGLLFFIGMGGFVLRRNMLMQLMCIELMLNAANLCLVACNRWRPSNGEGQLFALMVIAVAAAEAGVGLAVAINLFRLRRDVQTDELCSLKH